MCSSSRVCRAASATAGLTMRDLEHILTSRHFVCLDPRGAIAEAEGYSAGGETPRTARKRISENSAQHGALKLSRSFCAAWKWKSFPKSFAKRMKTDPSLQKRIKFRQAAEGSGKAFRRAETSRVDDSGCDSGASAGVASAGTSGWRPVPTV